MNPALEIRDVAASYGPFRALFGVSLSVPSGGSLALLGGLISVATAEVLSLGREASRALLWCFIGASLPIICAFFR